jgi:hypothetical protein
MLKEFLSTLASSKDDKTRKQGDQKIGKKAQRWEKVAQTVAKPKECQNSYIKYHFKSKKTTSNPLLIKN